MEKLKKTAKVLDVIAKAVRWICIILSALALAALIAALIGGIQSEPAETGPGVTLSLGMLRLKLSGPAPKNGNALAPAAAVSVITVCAIAALMVLAWEAHILHRVLSPMREGRPFDGRISKYLRTLGWVSLVQAVIFSVVSSVGNYVIFTSLDLMALFNRTLVTDYTVNIRFEAGYLLIPVAFFLLSWIFRYGEELQRQSDETL